LEFIAVAPDACIGLCVGGIYAFTQDRDEQDDIFDIGADVNEFEGDKYVCSQVCEALQGGGFSWFNSFDDIFITEVFDNVDSALCVYIFTTEQGNVGHDGGGGEEGYEGFIAIKEGI
jgi:hypothetical protein